MPDIIELLPDSVANQIAAGEVVQRPASVVKELMENSIDADSTQIDLLVKNAGKTLIKVIDNGTGMSETDARLSIERHATSKIRKVDDLFSLRTMGFRGEAVPSIAAVSRMEIKSRKKDTELGTHLILEGNDLISQEACQCKIGTQISIKDLFFNIPARRNFLKSNTVEYRHILEEFIRLALANPTVGMSLNNDGNEIYRLPASNYRQRIVNIYGKRYNERLVPIEESTDIVKISGFVGKPEYARRTRGDQYFFVNGRFIKNAYLNHAIQQAYEELIPSDQFAAYYVRLEIDPSKIDINIHPTKTEIKFEEERSIYAILRTAVRQALGKHNLTPSLDFEQEQSFSSLPKKGEAIPIPQIKVNPDYNPFQEQKKERKQADIHFPFKREERSSKQWEKLYEAPKVDEQTKAEAVEDLSSRDSGIEIMQLHKRYILSHLKSGFILIDQERAHQRILFEKFKEIMDKGDGPSQQLLFPVNIDLSANDYALIQSLNSDLKKLGFEINEFGKNSIIVQGIPAEAPNAEPTALIEGMLEAYKNDEQELKNQSREKLVFALAKKSSIKSGQKLGQEEMQNLIDELFATSMPYSLPNQKPIIVTYSLEELDKQFKRK